MQVPDGETHRELVLPTNGTDTAAALDGVDHAGTCAVRVLACCLTGWQCMMAHGDLISRGRSLTPSGIESSSSSWEPCGPPLRSAAARSAVEVASR